MDKHERRQLRKRDEKLGKINELYRASFSETEHRKKMEVFAALRNYSGKVVPNFVAFCLKYEEEHSEYELEWMWRIHNGFSRWGYDYVWRPLVISNVAGNGIWGHRREALWHILRRSDQRTTIRELLMSEYLSPEDEEYINGKRVLVYRGNSIDVRASISNGRQLIDKRKSMVEAYDLLRTKKRTNKIRNELVTKCERLRPILNFKHIKEELMMVAWHPKRIERILELGGWDALDNFAGC